MGKIQKTTYLEMLEKMLQIRYFEEQVASEIANYAFDYLDGPILRVAGRDAPMPYSKVLENYIIPSEERIEEAVRKVLS